jgi:hypothetical protein
VGMLRDVEPARVFVGEGRDGTAGLRIEFAQDAASHKRYIMA